MLEMFAAMAFWRRERRQEHQPVAVERRRMTPKRAQDQLLQSVDRLKCAVEKRVNDLSR